jgi:uncharacterized protein (DUF983 family)
VPLTNANNLAVGFNCPNCKGRLKIKDIDNAIEIIRIFQRGVIIFFFLLSVFLLYVIKIELNGWLSALVVTVAALMLMFFYLIYVEKKFELIIDQNGNKMQKS